MKLSQYTRKSLLISSEILTWWLIWDLGVIVMWRPYIRIPTPLPLTVRS